MRARIILTLFMINVVFLSFVARATRSMPIAQDGSGPVQGDTLVMRYDMEPESLNPLLGTSSNALYLMTGVNNSEVYEHLLRYDTKTWTLTQPLLAQAYPEISKDRRVLTYKLRDRIKWHDGRPVTSSDVVFTFKAAVCPGMDNPTVRDHFTELRNVEALDDRTIRFTFSTANAMNLINSGSEIPIIPKHIFDAESVLDGFPYADIAGVAGQSNAVLKTFADRFNKHPNNRRPVGTGPFKFESWDSGNEIVLSRNDAYWGRKANLDRIVVRIIRDSTAALVALKSGAVDFVPRLQPIQYAEQTGDAAFQSRFEKVRYTIPQFYFIGWNQERPYFRDKRVRQALTMLTNRAQLIASLRSGLAKPSSSPYEQNLPNHNPKLTPLPHNPKRGLELLDEAGWKDHDGDGIRDKDGVQFKFELLGSGSVFTRQLAAVLQDEFRKAGIAVTERTVDPAVLGNLVREHKYDAVPWAWTMPLDSDLYQIFHSDSIANGGANWVSFRNRNADLLLEAARVETDPVKKQQIMWRWQEIIHDEQPYTFLFHAEDTAAYDKRFRNVRWYPNRPGYDLNEWYVPKHLQERVSSSR